MDRSVNIIETILFIKKKKIKNNIFLKLYLRKITDLNFIFNLNECYFIVENHFKAKVF